MKNVEFSMTYLALKMFGKQLYANMSAAVSELVANGLDANASNVYVYMDIRDKTNATIAVYDDGDGMDQDDMEEYYAVVGRNKRKQISEEEAELKMGRKGIGKLAALYLSDTYYVITKKEDSECARAWKLDVTSIHEEEVNKKPMLEEQEYPFAEKHVFFEEFNERKKGTIILLENVLVKNFGDAAEDALEHNLANYFLTDNMEQKVKLCVLKKNSDPLEFKDVKKNIAFDNMAVIYTSDQGKFEEMSPIVKYKDSNLKTEDQIFEHNREVLSFPYEVETIIKDQTGNRRKVNNTIEGSIEIDGKKYDYKLEGWIGIHSTIDLNDSRLNCDNFRKNIFYNPNQLRVYVRNKLATPSFLSKLGLSATFLNYIEGEISFNILDHDDLEDIATAGRDNFSVQDERVKVLIEITKGIVNKLVNKRQKIADIMAENRKAVEEERKLKEEEAIKECFARGAVKSKEVMKNMNKEDRQALEEDFVQFSRATNLSNVTDRILISHKTDCEEFGKCLIEILTTLCPEIKDRIIFTSDSDFGVPQGQDILDYLKECFRSDLHVVFLFSKSFYDSNVCLAEAGAAWSTNKKYSSFVIDMGFNDITDPINRNQKGAKFIALSEDDYKDFSKELLRILESVKVPHSLELDEVIEVVKNVFEKREDMLSVPLYKPMRKFQSVPECGNCKHPMQIAVKDNQLIYSCSCGEEQNAQIVDRS